MLVAQSCPTLCNPWTVAHQAPLSVEFVRQEYYSGLPFPSLGYIPSPGIELGSPALKVDSLPSEAPTNNTHTHTHTHTHNVYFSIRKIKIEEMMETRHHQ